LLAMICSSIAVRARALMVSPRENEIIRAGLRHPRRLTADCVKRADERRPVQRASPFQPEWRDRIPCPRERRCSLGRGSEMSLLETCRRLLRRSTYSSVLALEKGGRRRCTGQPGVRNLSVVDRRRPAERPQAERATGSVSVAVTRTDGDHAFVVPAAEDEEPVEAFREALPNVRLALALPRRASHAPSLPSWRATALPGTSPASAPRPCVWRIPLDS
jgi:hypothetical protein